MIAELLNTDWRKLGQSSVDMGQRWSSMDFLYYSDSDETKITENIEIFIYLHLSAVKLEWLLMV
jgi:hypothetical protein